MASFLSTFLITFEFHLAILLLILIPNFIHNNVLANSIPLTNSLTMGVSWEKVAKSFGTPTSESTWGRNGKLFIYKEAIKAESNDPQNYQNYKEFQVYIDASKKIEGFLTIYPHGIELAKMPDILNKLPSEKGAFVKLKDKDNSKVLKFQGMLYQGTDKDKNTTTYILLTGPKYGYQYIYLEAAFSAQKSRQFYKQILEQVQKKIQWRSEEMKRKQ